MKKKIINKFKKCKLVLPLNFELYVNFEDLFLFQNGLFLFYWHHLAISTLVSVSLSWSLSWHHYDTYSCCSICFRKPVRGDWVGWWTVFCPYSLEGSSAQSCTRSELYLISAQAIFFHNVNCSELCTMCVFKRLVEFFNEWALYFAKSGLKVASL